MSTDDSMVDAMKKLIMVHDRILNEEVRAHALYSKVLVVTGLTLVVLGVLLAQYISLVGWLLILIGLLRSISSVYDFRREDSLKRKMRLVRQEFGDILAIAQAPPAS